MEIETFGSTKSPPIITVSIGVAGLHVHAETVDGLVEAADRALYRAKGLGKNRVAVARERGPEALHGVNSNDLSDPA